jgi:hypothetical protein
MCKKLRGIAVTQRKFIKKSRHTTANFMWITKIYLYEKVLVCGKVYV